MNHEPGHKRAGHNSTQYFRLAAMTLLSFGAMYGLMYAMVNRAENVYANLNQFYMAALMTAAMVLIELALMFGMYANRRLNAAIFTAGAIALVLSWTFTRRQTGISDEQFLKSMIPHHASAILMCEQASVTDGEIKDLCRRIRTSQQAEIDEMKAKLHQLSR